MRLCLRDTHSLCVCDVYAQSETLVSARDTQRERHTEGNKTTVPIGTGRKGEGGGRRSRWPPPKKNQHAHRRRENENGGPEGDIWRAKRKGNKGKKNTMPICTGENRWREMIFGAKGLGMNEAIARVFGARAHALLFCLVARSKRSLVLRHDLVLYVCVT